MNYTPPLIPNKQDLQTSKVANFGGFKQKLRELKTIEKFFVYLAWILCAMVSIVSITLFITNPECIILDTEFNSGVQAWNDIKSIDTSKIMDLDIRSKLNDLIQYMSSNAFPKEWTKTNYADFVKSNNESVINELNSYINDVWNLIKDKPISGYEELVCINDWKISYFGEFKWIPRLDIAFSVLFALFGLGIGLLALPAAFVNNRDFCFSMTNGFVSIAISYSSTHKNVKYLSEKWKKFNHNGYWIIQILIAFILIVLWSLFWADIYNNWAWGYIPSIGFDAISILFVIISLIWLLVNVVYTNHFVAKRTNPEECLAKLSPEQQSAVLANALKYSTSKQEIFDQYIKKDEAPPEGTDESSTLDKNESN